MKRKIFAILLGLFLCFSLGYASEEKKINVGSKVENFVYYTLDGKEMNSSDFLNKKKILLNFTATWCPYCIKEKKLFNNDYEEIKKLNPDLEIIFMFGPYGQKDRADTVEKVKNYLETNNYKFPAYFEKGVENIKSFGVQKIPTTILIDKQGTVLEKVSEYNNLKGIVLPKK